MHVHVTKRSWIIERRMENASLGQTPWPYSIGCRCGGERKGREGKEISYEVIFFDTASNRTYLSLGKSVLLNLPYLKLVL